MKIIGFDQSLTQTAIVVLERDTLELINFHVIKTKGKTRDGEEDFSITDRISNIRNTAKDLIENTENLEACAIEGLSLNKNSKTVRLLAGLFYNLTVLFKEKEVPFHVIAPTTVKKTAQKGSASKEEVFSCLPEEVAEAFLEAGYKKTTGLLDLSDAYFIALSAINKIKNT